MQDAANSPQRIRDRLAGHHLLVTGSTGFLAKAFVEKLLRAVDTIGGIHLLVRAKSDGTTVRQRVMREVLGTKAFDRLRASLGDGFNRLCEEKIFIVQGDLTGEHLGMDRRAYQALTERITLIVNSAATVTFDERLDLAVALNTLGPRRLLKLARDCGNIPLLHVSTCYVCGARRGEIVEDFAPPEAAREKLPRDSRNGEYDVDGLVEFLQAEATELRHRFGADTEACRRELIDAGMRIARSFGWNDTYTFTKWIGEQLLVTNRGDVPLVIFRPAIIEGSYDEPTPGWIDGLRMADPIIVAYGRGKLDGFPARSEIAIDLIPVDFVANAMIATLPAGEAKPAQPVIYQCASTDCNPLILERLRVGLERAFLKRPMTDDEGRPIRVGRLRVEEQTEFLARWDRKRKRLAKALAIMKAVGATGRRYRRLSAAHRQIEQVIYFAKIYSPYTHLDCRFVDDNLRAAAGRLHPEDRELFPFDAKQIDWDDYIVNRHVPGLRSFVLGTAGETTPRILAVGDWDDGGPPAAADALRAESLFEVFERAVKRFGEKPALQVRRNHRWIRYTFDDALRATGMIMRRFVERGLAPGDRIAICAESCPEWGLTYLAAMRAGLTTVPLDPQLPPADAWAAARFAQAKLMCASPPTAEGLEKFRGAEDPDVVVLREPFIPQPGASRDQLPEPVRLSASAVASILFTSGTTARGALPKAVQLTHRNFIANANALIKVHHVTAADQLLSVLPMYHALEFTGGFLVPLVCGATITYLEQLKGSEIVSAMQATGSTVMLVVPRLLRLFHDSIEQNVALSARPLRWMFRFISFLSTVSGYRFGRFLFRSVHKRFGGRLRMFVSGGSRLDPTLFHSFARMGFPVYEGYGLTETGPVLTVNPKGRAKPASVGPPLPGVELEIRNANLEGIGEVWAKGSNIMSGYLNNPDATHAVLQGEWFRSGDLGRLDENGFLYLTGRSTDLIVTSAGKNVYPDEVESRYDDLPYAKEMCVFGVPSEDGLGDEVHAVVVIDDLGSAGLDHSSIEREIRLAVADIGATLPSHQRIAVLHFWDRELPKTSTLKAKRGRIRDIILAERTRSVGRTQADEDRRTHVSDDGEGEESAEDRERLAAVRRIVAKRSKQAEHTILPQMHLHLDLGIDSIGKMDVITEVETVFGMSIDGAKAAEIARVKDMLTIIGDRSPKTAVVARSVSAWQRRLSDSASPLARLNGTLPPPLLPMRWLVRGGVAAFMKSYVRVRAIGREHLPAGGPFILAPNHSSHLDTPAVLTAVGGARRVWIAGAEDYFFNNSLKRLVFGKLLDTIPFDRQADGVLGLRRCCAALRRGDGLLLFPEGTRSTDGQLQPFKIGVAVLSVEIGVPIVPVHIDRAFALWPKGRRFVRPGMITVRFGERIDPPVVADDEDRQEVFRRLAGRVELAVTRFSTEVSQT